MGRTGRTRARRKSSSTSQQCLDHREDHIDLAKSLAAVGWTNETQLRVANFPLIGRGVYSTKNLKANDLLIEINTSALITIYTIENDDGFRKMFGDRLASGGHTIRSQCLFAIYILYLRHHKRKTAYIESIPNDFTVPYFCNDKELHGISDDIQEKVVGQRQIINRTYQTLELVFGQTVCWCCQQFLVPTIVNKSSFEWAFFAVNSRSVYLDPDDIAPQRSIDQILCDKPNMALAPFLDLLNHSSNVETVQRVRRTANSLPLYQLYTKTPVQRYEQIFISYGALDNIKLITEYGFSLPANRFDVFTFTFEEVMQLLPSIPYKLKLFFKAHTLDQNLNISRDHGFSHSFLRIFHLLENIAKDASLSEHGGRLSRLVYADGAELLSDSARNHATNLIAHKITIFSKRLNYFERLRSSGRLSDGVMGYVHYLEDSLRWLEEFLNKPDKIC